jgi:hypothetical protein
MLHWLSYQICLINNDTARRRFTSQFEEWTSSRLVFLDIVPVQRIDEIVAFETINRIGSLRLRSQKVTKEDVDVTLDFAAKMA